ncbi:MAG: ribonuclease III [Anaerolineales bacterium]|jgi:ribonuclease-3
MKNQKGEFGAESPQEFAQRLGLEFEDILLLSRALTHRSYLNEHPEAIEDNERLEFLGDAVLDYVVGVWLYNRFPEMAEGELTRLRAALVKTDQLADFGRQIELGRALRLGRGEEENGGRKRRAMLCGAYEALMGAITLDLGIPAVERFISEQLEAAVEEILMDQRDKDPKSLLQEIVQSGGYPAPNYIVVGESGPDHAKIFQVEVFGKGELLGKGNGTSKHEASMKAAQNALDKFNLI